MKKTKKCCGKCAAKKVAKVSIGRTARLELKMKPEIKERSDKLLKDLGFLKQEKVTFAQAWEYIVLPTLEEMTKVAVKQRKQQDRERAAAAKAAKATKKVSVKKTK